MVNLAQPPPACSQIARAVAWLPLSNREQVEGPTPCQLPVQTGSVPSEQEDTRSWSSQTFPHLDQDQEILSPSHCELIPSKHKLITRPSTHRWCRKLPLCKPAIDYRHGYRGDAQRPFQSGSGKFDWCQDTGGCDLEPDKRGHVGSPSMDYRRLVSHWSADAQRCQFASSSRRWRSWGGAFTCVNHYRPQ